ncbi:hypothetical protein J5X84_24220 [Streptosporangiaceae bacterium NEAU-GS5]|nr:hypothetical protein [Streptosporangiaceae bacterium NEAU-GS5]
MALDDNVGNKHPGDLIKSDDWNKLAGEVHRVDALLGAALGATLLPVVPRGWANFFEATDYQNAIEHQVQVDQPTSVLLLGLGQGLVTGTGILDLVIKVDGNILHPVSPDNFEAGDKLQGLSWGMGFVQGQGFWQQVIALGQSQLAAGSHQIALACRSRTGGRVQLNGPTLWMLKSGSF